FLKKNKMNSNFITETEKLSREKAVRAAIDNNRLEGLEPSQEFIDRGLTLSGTKTHVKGFWS
ncbi:TPA: antitoxin VbhA family protein, partial [Neisseria gonorrhoeae]